MIAKAALERLEGARAHVDREALLAALFAQMRGKAAPGVVDGGRYAFLWRALRGETDLLEDLGRGRQAKWQPVVRQRCEQDAEFLRGVALLHWEWALEFESTEDATLAMSHHERARYYWAHLLGRQGYWSALQTLDAPATARPTAQAAVARAGRDYGGEARARVRDALLGHHIRRSREHFHRFANSTSRERDAAFKAARGHLGLLWGWNLLSGDAKPAEPLLNQEWDREALADADRKSQELIAGWVSEWLTAANRRLEDRQVELPNGISKNFAGALDSVRPCLELASVRPALFQRVLLFFVKQSFEWCVEAASAESRERARQILAGAEDALKQLAAVAPKPGAKSVLTDEQATIARVYDALAKLEEDADRSLGYAKQALVWRPGDKDLERMVREAPHLKILREVGNLTKRGEYAGALRLLQGIPSSFSDYDEVQKLRANCECNLGVGIANAGDLHGAIPHLETAQRLYPDDPWINAQLNAVRQLLHQR